MDMFERLKELASQTEDYEIPLQQGVVWSLRTAPGALVSAITGFGKSYLINYWVIMLSQKNAILFLADPKRSDLASLSAFMPSDRVVWEIDKILKMVEQVIEIMKERYTYMETERLKRGLFQADFVDYGLPIIMLIIEEMGAFVSALDKKTREKFEADIKSIILMGRQAGVMICSVMQNPGTQNISSEIRSQLGLRIYLGNSIGTEYRMIFGDGYTYENRLYKPGQGLYMLSGVTEQPEMIETPRLNKSQLADTLKHALQSQFDVNPMPPSASLRSRSEAEAEQRC